MQVANVVRAVIDNESVLTALTHIKKVKNDAVF